MATEFMLTAEGIDEASEEVAAFLARNGMASREAMAGRLSFENALILLREHLGDGVPASLVVNKGSVPKPVGECYAATVSRPGE